MKLLLKDYTFCNFNKLNINMIENVQKMLKNDIPEILNQIKTLTFLNDDSLVYIF